MAYALLHNGTMGRFQIYINKSAKLLSLALSLTVLSAPSAWAEMNFLASNHAPRFEEGHLNYNPLSRERLQQLGLSAQDYEHQSQYGLLDYNSETMRHSDLRDQRDGVIREILMYQADGQLRGLKTRIEEEARHSVIAQSALFLGTAYLFMNGKTFTTHLSENVDFSGNAKVVAGTHAFYLTRRNISPLGFSSGIGYQMESDSNPTLNASVSKELTSHIVASLGQKRSLAGSPSTPTESTGEIHFGASF